MPTAWLDLPAPPALPGLFLRAALRRGIRGKALPERGLRSEVTVDPKHLERYRQVCGFRDDGLLPPTYPHILAFPLQMALLTDKRFPFPLLGLVHLENRIDVLRALGGLGPFTVSVAVENLQPHDKGATFSIVTRLEDQLGLLWVGDSKVLCRGVKVPGEIPPKAEQEPLPLEPVDNWKAPADIGRRYARAAGDYNPIHLSAPSAKLFGFPAPSPTACGTRLAAWPPSASDCQPRAIGSRCASRSQCCCRPASPSWPARRRRTASSACAARTTCRTWPGIGAGYRADAGPPCLEASAQSPKLCGCLPPPRRIPMDLHELTARLHAIRDRNDWRQFHSPKNLAMAASVEMAELVEIFQWLTEDQSRTLSAEQLEHAGQEVGDIVLYLLLFCGETGLDLEQVVRAKLADCERRFLP